MQPDFHHGLLGALVALVSLCSPAVAAVDEYLGKPIGTVSLVIENHESADPSLTRVVETRVGEPLTMAAVRDSITHLYSLGRFDDIRVDATMADTTRVALHYQLSPIHPVAGLTFAGQVRAPGVETGQLRRAIEDRYGALPPLSRAEELKQMIGDLLIDRGYLHANITLRADISHAPERATLVFGIDPGPRTTIEGIDTVGVATGPARVLLERLGVTKGAPYQRELLNARVERYVAERRKAGFYEAKVIVTPHLRDDDKIVDLTLTVSPGPHVRVVFTGDSLPAERRAEWVPVEREGSVDEDLLEDSTNRIEDALRADGYRDGKAEHSRAESDGEMVVTFDVRRGPRYRVDRVEISGNASVPLADFEPDLRLRDGDPFLASKLDADLSLITNLYRRRGFAAVKVQAAEEPQPVPANAEARVVPLRVRLLIAEGPRTVISTVRTRGNTVLSEEALVGSVGSQPGRPYLEAQLALDRDLMQQRLLDLGYANATVDAAADFSTDRTMAGVVFTVREGARVLVDHVLIVGQVRTSSETIERALQIKAGDPLSLSAQVESRRRLAALGLFRRVQIAELDHGDEGLRDVLVTVEESPATTVVFGVGAEGRLNVTRTADAGGAATQRPEVFPRGSFQISRRNLFGKDRSVSLFTSVSVRLQKQQVFTDQGSLSGDQLSTPEYRVLGTYREPRVFETGADALVTGTFEQQVRSSFSFARRGVSAEVARQVTPQIGLSASYQIQRTRVFASQVAPADQLLIDRVFPQVRLSSVSVSGIRDTRDDVVDPGVGSYVSANVQLAGRRIGSEVGLAKTFARIQLFKTVPSVRRLVLAGNASLGLATGFPREVVTTDAQGVTTAQTIEDLPASERFFAGGDTTVRGFALDALGTPETIDKDGFPIGGNATVIFNAEARFSVLAKIQVVGFLDAGNVFAHAIDLDLGLVRSAVGFGVRYKSPVGPIRIDLGFKTRRDLIAGQREGPTAFHISLGQAF
jgi:outer membrane protein assembly complex protein YaeT